MLSTQVRNQARLLVLICYIRGSSTGLGIAQRIDSSLRADWLSCFWPFVNGGLPDRGIWCRWGKEDCDNPAGPLASRWRVWPFGRVVRAQARDSECAINPGSRSNGVVGAETLQYICHCCLWIWTFHVQRKVVGLIELWYLIRKDAL